MAHFSSKGMLRVQYNLSKVDSTSGNVVCHKNEFIDPDLTHLGYSEAHTMKVNETHT